MFCSAGFPRWITRSCLAAGCGHSHTHQELDSTRCPILHPPHHADNESKWRQLGELALANGQLAVAQRCFERAKDLGGLLLLYSSHADAQGIDSLAQLAGGWVGGPPGKGCKGGE